MKQNIQTFPVSLLLADDDKDDRFFFQDVLSKLTVRTVLTTVDDGEKLMSYLTKNAKNLPSALFLDFNMPRRNGFECLMDIKADKLLQSLPVIMYSTSLNETVADELYKIGAHYYIRKTSLNDLSSILDYVLNMLTEDILIKPSREGFILHPGDPQLLLAKSR